METIFNQKITYNITGGGRMMSDYKPSYEDLYNFAKWTRGFWVNGIEIMRKNKLKIDNLDDPMQKLAFTFYTDLCEIDREAQYVLEGV